MKLFLLSIAAIGIMSVWLGCSSLGGGVGSEAEARVPVQGRLIDGVSGLPSGNTQVRLLPADFDPVKDTAPTLLDTTDSQGMYRFEVPRTGRYALSGVQISHRTRCAIYNIAVAHDPVDVPPGLLRAPGSITVKVTASMNDPFGYVYIPGTTLSLLLADNGGTVIFDSVPVGVVPEVRYAALYTSAPSRQISGPVDVQPLDTASIAYPGLVYYKKLVLNTSANGANVPGKVTDFPVLVRLTATNFDFSQARGDGADIRFTKQNGTPLSYEIEQWEPARRTAAIWVRVDTIYGNNGTQAIFMRWGLPPADSTRSTPTSDVPSFSNGAAVFDTASGFQGVWHLKENGTDTIGGYQDATINGNHGTGRNMTPGTVMGGRIGNAQAFNGADASIEVPYSSALNPDKFTVSCWALYDKTSADTLYRSPVASRSDNFTGFLLYAGNNYWEGWAGTGTGWGGKQVPGPAIAANVWTALTIVYDGKTLKLFTDGMERLHTPLSIVKNQLGPLLIGGFPDSSIASGFFSGRIDEVVISSKVRTPDWIRLCYLNQKEPDALVEFE
jgi:hypothetical protein